MTPHHLKKTFRDPRKPIFTRLLHSIALGLLLFPALAVFAEDGIKSLPPISPDKFAEIIEKKSKVTREDIRHPDDYEFRSYYNSQIPLSYYVFKYKLDSENFDLKTIHFPKRNGDRAEAEARLDKPTEVMKKYSTLRYGFNGHAFATLDKFFGTNKNLYVVGAETNIRGFAIDNEGDLISDHGINEVELWIDSENRAHLGKYPESQHDAIAPKLLLTSLVRWLLKSGVNRGGNNVHFHPRTGIGVNQDRTEVVIVVADGRLENSRGLTLTEMGELMKFYGVHNAINLDGGASSTVVRQRIDPQTKKRTVEKLNTSVGTFGFVGERPLPNMIGLVELK